MIWVLDDALSEQMRGELFNKYHNNANPTPAWIQNMSGFNGPEYELYVKVAKVFSVENATCVEMWSHFNSRPSEHFDKDEGLYNATGQFRFPLCSIVYYPFIENLVGGELVVDGITITPKTNRLLAFSPGLLHRVNTYSGNRFSFLINPWDHPPTA